MNWKVVAVPLACLAVYQILSALSLAVLRWLLAVGQTNTPSESEQQYSHGSLRAFARGKLVIDVGAASVAVLAVVSYTVVAVLK